MSFSNAIKMRNIISLLLFICISCVSCHTSNNQDISLSLSYGDYTVTLKTMIDKTHCNIRWEEYGFSYPYILSQELVFCHKGRRINEHTIPIPKRKWIINGNNHYFQQIPIFDIELLQGSNDVLIHLYGANYCCGISCPEYNGLYMLDGTVVSECISTMDQPLNGTMTNADVDYAHPLKRESMINIFKPI